MKAITNTFTTIRLDDSFVYFAYLAQSTNYNYGESAYSTAPFNGDRQANNANLKNLINSGTVVSFTVATGALIVFSVLLARFWKRPKKSNRTNKAK